MKGKKERLKAKEKEDRWDWEGTLFSVFRRHGTLCATYPAAVLSVTLVAVAGLSAPLLMTSMTSTTPTTTPVTPITPTATSTATPTINHLASDGRAPIGLQLVLLNSTSSFTAAASTLPFLLPAAFLHHYLENAKLSVSYDKYKVFHYTKLSNLSEELVQSGTAVYLSLADLCLSVNFSSNSDSSCLILSPLLFWNDSIADLAADPEILRTLSSLSRIPLNAVFTGIAYENNNDDNEQNNEWPRQRRVRRAEAALFTVVIDYQKVARLFLDVFDGAVDTESMTTTTTTMQEFVSCFFDTILEDALTMYNTRKNLSDQDNESLIPASKIYATTSNLQKNNMLYYYPSTYLDEEISFATTDNNFSVEFVIIVLSYVIVFFYISLVLGRVELVKSKFALGFGAVLMVFSALTMSVGLTCWLGVTTSLVA
ncbi:hypothetical protein HK100_008024, partial [Physocladia obscura]